MERNTGDNETALINAAVGGDRKALEQLIERHRNWIFNVALSFVADRDDAADVTQEVLIRIVTKLSTFRHESDFRTWVYRIVKNHFLNMKRRKYEAQAMTFDVFAKGLDSIADEALHAHAYEVEEKMLVEEAKLSCMKAMLLCLDREQRLVYILGELFEFTDAIGAEIMEVTRENFRIKLHRARQQLYSFMDHKCGLVNQKNPCRCAKKTAGFIKMGFVDPVKLHFQRDAVASINAVAGQKVEAYTEEVLHGYRELFRSHPFLKADDQLEGIRRLLDSDTFRKTFNLDR